MVYRGPSSGCETCRRRKIKCDENDPCRRCVRLGVTCPGKPQKTNKPTQKSRNAPPKRAASTSSVPTRGTIGLDGEPWQELEESSIAPDSEESDDQSIISRQGTNDSFSWKASAEDGDATLALMPHPTISWKDVGIAKFLSFIRSDPGETNPWSTMIADYGRRPGQRCSYFEDALAAVSLQRLSKDPNLKPLQRQAAAAHGKALRHFGRAMQNLTQAASDESLLTVRLFIIYGFNAMYPATQSRITFGDPSQDGPAQPPANLPTPNDSSHPSPAAESIASSMSPSDKDASPASPAYTDPDPIVHCDPAAGAIAPHFDGLLYMLLARGPEQMQNSSTLLLYHTIRDRIICNYSKRCRVLPVSRDSPQWEWFFNSPTISAADTLTNIAVDIPLVRCAAAALRHETDPTSRFQLAHAQRNDAYNLLSRLEAWFVELPVEWREPRIVEVNTSQFELGMHGEHKGLYHIYPDPFVALVMGRYKAYRILLLQVIATSIKAELKNNEWSAGLESPLLSTQFLEKEYETTASNQRTIVDEICAMMAVYTLDNERVYELDREIPPCGMQYGGHLIEPILIAQTVPCVPGHQMKFLGMKMKEFLGR